MLSIDVSYANGKVAWPTTAPLVELVFVKATGTHLPSPNQVDAQFKNNWQALGQYSGIVRGAYHFHYFDMGTPGDQAKMFLDTVQPGPGDLVAVDLEEQDSVWVNANKGVNVQLAVKAWLDAVEAAIGRKPFIYTSQGWWSQYACTRPFPYLKYIPPAWASNYPLWVANYTSAAAPALPVGWTNYIIWQYAGTESKIQVPGVGVDPLGNKYCDINRLSMPSQSIKQMWGGNQPAVLTLSQKVDLLWADYIKLHPQYKV